MTGRDWQVVEIDGAPYRWRSCEVGVEVLGYGAGCRVLTLELAPSTEVGPKLVIRLLRAAREMVGWDPADPDEDLDLRLLG